MTKHVAEHPQTIVERHERVTELLSDLSAPTFRARMAHGVLQSKAYGPDSPLRRSAQKRLDAAEAEIDLIVSDYFQRHIGV
jgi:hypothetical protein